MRLFAITCTVFLTILFVAACSADKGFLNARCNEAKDCYVTDDLHLACWHNVHKCKCSNTFQSNFHLKWQNDQCLMSKYGPCGQKGVDLIVGCQDGFVCINNQCREPNDLTGKAVKLVPLIFDESDCSKNYCEFSENLRLTCNHGNKCECQKIYVADGRDTRWDIRNYDGENECSVGKFGPCGTNDGITVECHGDGITCVSGTCLNASHPISDVGEDCAYTSNCKDGLQCSQDYVCIERFSLDEGKICEGNEQCRKGLVCRRNGPFSLAFCVQQTPINN